MMRALKAEHANALHEIWRALAFNRSGSGENVAEKPAQITVKLAPVI